MIMEERGKFAGDAQAALKEISLELQFIAGALADIALPAYDDPSRSSRANPSQIEASETRSSRARPSQVEAAGRGTVTARQVAALLAARARRAAAFPLPVADPHWTLLLALFQAHLERRPLRPAAAADRAPLHRLLALGLAAETRGAWTLTPDTAQALRRHLDDERRALTGR